jgi:hypothetical protein
MSQHINGHSRGRSEEIHQYPFHILQIAGQMSNRLGHGAMEQDVGQVRESAMTVLLARMPDGSCQLSNSTSQLQSAHLAECSLGATKMPISLDCGIASDASSQKV